MSVTLHTTTGDIKLELYCDKAPKACENFLALCASDYYKNCIFHRNIKDFMVQTGDPTGQGKGGQSIWGAPFEDEFSTELSHSKRGVLSMANNGPNTNKSQFFLTYAPAKHLDLKYTIFGHASVDQLAKSMLIGINLASLTDSTLLTNSRLSKLTLSIVLWSKTASKMSPSMLIPSLLNRTLIRRLLLICSSRATTLLLSPSSNFSSRLHFSSTSSLPPSFPPSSPSPSSAPSNEELLSRVRQMNEYYSQYIEEYEEPSEAPEEERPQTQRPERVVATTISEIVELLRGARAVDIAVFSRADPFPEKQLPGEAEYAEQEAVAPFVVVCSSMNPRHGRAVAAVLSDSSKASEGEGTRRTAKQAAGWLIVNVSEADTIVHVMDEQVRRYFDLESMLSGAEEREGRARESIEGEVPDIPPPRNSR